MARKEYQEVHADVKGEFESVIVRIGLDNFINIKVLGDEKQKKDVIKVNKVNDLNYHLHKEDVILTVNQGIFEQLTPELKVIAIEDVLAGISYNTDKDVLQSNVADVKTFSGVLSRYGYDNYHILQESVKTLFATKAAGDTTK